MKLEHYVIFSLAMVIIMTIAVLTIQIVTGADLSAIYGIWCTIFGGEILSCALIKIFKLKEQDGQ